MEKAKLCELVDIYLGVTHTPEYVFNGVPFLSVKDISGGKICFNDCKYISQEEYDSLSEGAKPKVGDMLFCRVGTLGKPIIIPEGTPLFGSFVSLGYLRNKNTDRCDLNYLRYWMYSNSFWKQVNSNVKGASQVNLNTGWLSKFDVDLPDMQEQKHRISVLDKCKAIIEQREEELKVLDNLIKARFVEVFGNPDTNSKGWNECVLSEKLNVVGGYTFKSDQFDEISGIPVLRIGNINAGFFKPVNLVYWHEDENLERYAIYPGDLVMSLTGTVGKDDYGNVCILGDEYEMYYLNQRNAKLEIKEGIDKYYLSQLLKFAQIKKRLTGISRGVRQANISNKDILNLVVPVPPIELQEQFANFVHQVDKSKVAVQKALDETQLLFDSLMQQYFG